MRRIESEADIAAGLADLATRDPRLIPVIARAGPVPLRRSRPGFAGLASIIVSQMISKASAAAIWNRLDVGLGTVEARAFLALGDADARAIGLSGAKIDALRAVAMAVEDRRLDLDAICALEGREAIATLCALKGIGRWTAEVYLLVCAGHPDVFPVGDVALQSAVGQALGLDTRPTARALNTVSLAWTPWRSVAARLFWADYARVLRRDAAPEIV